MSKSLDAVAGEPRRAPEKREPPAFQTVLPASPVSG